MADRALSGKTASDAEAADPRPDDVITYEPPRLTPLGSVTELTAGATGGNSDFLSPGTALS